MTAPTRPLPPVPPGPSGPSGLRARPARRRRFDLRSTAFFFAFLALLLTLGGMAVRTAAAAWERHPAGVAAVLLLVVAGVVAGRRGRRRWSARRLVRRTTEALEEAAETAAEALDAAPPASAAPAPPAPVAPDLVAPGPAAHDPVPTAAPPPDRDEDAPPTAPVPPGTPLAWGEELDPAEFEQAIAGLCARDGCTDVEVVGGAGDLGADVLAVAPDGRTVVIQCKRYADGHKVGSQDLQRFGGTCFTVHAADVAVVVTTSDFTAPAAEYAEQCGIVCVAAEDLEGWRSGTGPRPWEACRAEG
ncbi:restriction endonuclease [Streptomyces sp. NPDC003247]|uniref:restriction endonuclease n=1 Tax=Streptomyces sp. NPDC003247 TaxID=3364677 RepID=UPI00369DA89E